MNIGLIGYRAAGKSTLGQLVSSGLGWRFLDVDRGIEQQSGKTIKALYEEEGDQVYRDLESQVVETMCAEKDCVIAFGAGSLMRPRNQVHARRVSLLFFLELPADVLWDRIRSDPGSEATRPNLSSGGLGEVVEVLAQRAPVYRECAHKVLDGTRPAEHLAEVVMSEVSARQSGERPA